VHARITRVLALVLFALLAVLALVLWLTSHRPMRWLERRYWRKRNYEP
jgi:HAMP domain-containing protein